MSMNPTYQSGFASPQRGRMKYPELWRGCVGAWAPCLGPTGLVLRDHSGYGNHGAMVGVSSVVSSGVYGLSFSGSGTGGSVPDSPTLRTFPAGQLTLCTWLKPSALTAGDRIYCKRSSVGAPIELYLSDAGATRLHLIAGDHTGAYSNPGLVIDGELHHYAVVHNGSDLTFYRDGKYFSAGNAAVIPAACSDTGTLYIGRYFGGDPRYRGIISQIDLFNTALQPKLIARMGSRPGIAYELAPRRRSSILVPANITRYNLFTGASAIQIIGGAS